MAEAYRFNGPVPEAVKQLKQRRVDRKVVIARRASSIAGARWIMNSPSTSEQDKQMAREFLEGERARVATRWPPGLLVLPAQSC